METNIVSVERLKEYSELDTEVGKTPHLKWSKSSTTFLLLHLTD